MIDSKVNESKVVFDSLEDIFDKNSKESKSSKSITALEDCACVGKLTTEKLIGLINYLRHKQNYKSYKNKFFDLGKEFVFDFRVANEIKILTSDLSQIVSYCNSFNLMCDNFSVNTCLKKIHFIAQSYLETKSLRSVYEDRTETNTPSNYMGGYFFQGRGMKQITHDYNYLAYYSFYKKTDHFKKIFSALKGSQIGSVKGVVEQFDVTKYFDKKKNAYQKQVLDLLNLFSITDPILLKQRLIDFYEELKQFAHLLATDSFHSFNSAGWYVFINTKTGDYMDEDSVEKVSKSINTGNAFSSRVPNNYQERINYTNWVKEYFNYSAGCK